MKAAEFRREAAKGEADEEKEKRGSRRRCLRDTGVHPGTGQDENWAFVGWVVHVKHSPSARAEIQRVWWAQEDPRLSNSDRRLCRLKGIRSPKDKQIVVLMQTLGSTLQNGSQEGWWEQVECWETDNCPSSFTTHIVSHEFQAPAGSKSTPNTVKPWRWGEF